ncbi:uncharacterized protein LOC118743099 [Rhagoletis pomonella]|uniref:uncharacterized protein LOC118743099 n=1 Tax=Rhagoletis pomonella TaxID=28610 RepID=UPI00177DA946|nr:uncharacterized protein LOC118743099 [Rhagoletis pomonella]
MPNAQLAAKIYGCKKIGDPNRATRTERQKRGVEYEIYQITNIESELRRPTYERARSVCQPNLLTPLLLCVVGIVSPCKEVKQRLRMELNQRRRLCCCIHSLPFWHAIKAMIPDVQFESERIHRYRLSC